MSDERIPITISDLFDYPVTLDSTEFKKYSGKDLFNELNAIGGDVPEQIVTVWLDAAHENVYNLIYQKGGKRFKDNIINRDIDIFSSALKSCLISQLQCMLDVGGDYGVIDGSHTNSEGELKLIATKFIKDKIIAPKVYTTLRATKPDLIMGVTDDLHGGNREGV